MRCLLLVLVIIIFILWRGCTKARTEYGVALWPIMHYYAGWCYIAACGLYTEILSLKKGGEFRRFLQGGYACRLRQSPVPSQSGLPSACTLYEILPITRYWSHSGRTRARLWSRLCEHLVNALISGEEHKWGSSTKIPVLKQI